MIFIMLGLGGVFILAVWIFTSTAPQIGEAPKGADLERLRASEHFNKDKFFNLIDTKPGDFSSIFTTLPKFFFGKNQSPEAPLPTDFEEEAPLVDSIARITWYGHSTFLMEMQGQKILIDPMFGPVASPVSFGSKRFAYKDTIPLAELTDIDAVIISHDHYDHLDYPSILALKDKVKHFYTPLGVGSHLKHWGVDASNITELDWWEDVSFNGIQLSACPSRHFSGRSINDRDATQWASWVIKGKHQNIYFSGDGGYGPHFKEIGDKYGPFDIAMMECGQYNEAWKDIHMMPEESVQAGIDVQGKVLMPIHWGAFKLSVHEWTEPVTRFKKECENKNVELIHPIIGDSFLLGEELPQEKWWEL